MDVPPLRVELVEGSPRFIRMAFCTCPAGREQKEAAATEQNYADWKSRARQIVEPLNAGKFGEYRFISWDRARHAGEAAVWADTVDKYAALVRPDGGNWLYLHGNYGTGKTHLAVAAVRKIAGEKLWTPCVVVWSELCSLTQESWGTDTSTAGDWENARTAGILLVDDLDKTRTSEWAMEKLLVLVNYRYNRRKPTIFTANHSLEHLKNKWAAIDAGQAVLSRIAEMLWDVVEFSGDDCRWG